MAELSQDQVEKRASIQKTAMIWGVIVGVVAGLLALWILGSQGAALRYGGAAVVALVAGFFVHRASFNSGAKSAKCEKCGAAFSISRTDRQETLAASEAKEEREEQPDKSVKVTTWTEETYDVVETYTCANCGDITTRSYQTTRRRDEKETVEPAPEPDAPKKSSAKGGQKGGSGKGASGNRRGGKSRKS